MSETLHTYFNVANLELAYRRLLCSPDRMVKDRLGMQAIAVGLEDNLRQLSDALLSGVYIPRKGFKYYEPKSSGTQRTKTLLFVEDAIVYQAMANVIAARVYPQLAENEDFVFGSVLSPAVTRGTELLQTPEEGFFFFRHWKHLYGRFKDAVIKAIEVDKASHKFETDITGFFDSIPHYNLMMTLSEEFGVEDELLDVLSVCLNAWSGTRERSTPGVGIPQGPQASFFLANLLLHPLDKLVIGEALKYYRYMDDIHIYGYSEEELLDVLVRIDQYLKGHGLSINSKKTRIQRIDPSREDETVRTLRRFQVLGPLYGGDDELGEQVGRDLSAVVIEADAFSDLVQVTTIADPEEIARFWRAELAVVERELPALFEADSLVLKDEVLTADIDFIRLSARYGQALQALKALGPVQASEALLPYWLFGLRKYFWRVSNLVITLQHYAQRPLLKEALMDLYAYGKNYEFYRYQVVTCMSYNCTFSHRELREMFKRLQQEESDLVRYALYCLVIKQDRDPQLMSSLKRSLAAERDEYLKMLVLGYWRRDKDRVETMEELLQMMGL
jgi:acyl carrier protein